VRKPPPPHPFARATSLRVGELADRLDPFTLREIWALLGEHEDEDGLCRACNAAPFPCPPVELLAGLLRVGKLANAKACAEAMAEDVRAAGVEILTVLRRPGLDTLDRANTSPPIHPDIEMFGFELVYPGGTVPLMFSGLPVERFKEAKDFYRRAAHEDQPVIGGVWSARDWTAAVKTVADRARR
jgi:hypothetical protein